MTRDCIYCGNRFELRYRTTERFCSRSCAYSQYFENKKFKPIEKVPTRKRKPIRKVSKKLAKLTRQYNKLRRVFLLKPENMICFIGGCGARATTVEHRKGRKGFGDYWARVNDIPLLIDERFWAPCCHAHNLELENNGELSMKYQLSKLHGGKKL